jgi:uncharacterized phage protein (TIGR02220 family)
MKASHKKRPLPVTIGKNKSSVLLNKGQFVWGRHSCAEVFGWNPSTAKKRMDKLKNLGCILIESNNHYSIITICNWELYQPKEDEKVTTEEQPGDSQVTAGEQPGNTKKNVNNYKKKEYREIANRIINFLNEKASKRFTLSETNQKHIMARLEFGATEKDCEEVILNQLRDKHFIENPKYLNPETLFRPSNFEKYLNNTPDKKLSGEEYDPEYESARQKLVDQGLL